MGIADLNPLSGKMWKFQQKFQQNNNNMGGSSGRKGGYDNTDNNNGGGGTLKLDEGNVRGDGDNASLLINKNIILSIPVAFD